ncbi:MAG: DegV family protein, partial [Clostridia bacterium]|nr:DegV family protein [Clostridia bacterium]
MSVFFCDSNCELWHTTADELGIRSISMPYAFDDQEYDYDLGKTHDFVEFYSRLRRGEMPTTMALNPQIYIDIFEPVFASGEDIIYVGFSSAMSGTFQFMRQAVDELLTKYPERKFSYADTLNISVGAGFVVLEAAKLHNAGASDEEVVAFVNSFRDEVGIYFTAYDLMHLKRGGRISATSAIFGTALGIKPVLTVSADGRVSAIDKVIGRKKAIQSLFQHLQNEGSDLDKYP